MNLVIAAIKLGTDPVAPLPPATFHRTLEEFLYCPKCDATYSLVVDYDWAVSRHFEDESRRHMTLLRKSIFRGHSVDHRITHFETNGVMVQSIVKPAPPELKPITPVIQ
jgi:uncharacterized C2H2 Zn-finger protein